ncbi:unnamed protein product [Calicophoron daubneyi]|uniref:Uncharacterized protein n=1 Tax=Calicophoron daubneyi TaxID=300641 RepID=A0AAV2T5T1_CALDB
MPCRPHYTTVRFNKRPTSVTTQKGDSVNREFSSMRCNSVDKAVGTSTNEYYICYAPMRLPRARGYNYRNLLVSYWLPIAQTGKNRDPQKKACWSQATTSGDIGESMTTWEPEQENAAVLNNRSEDSWKSKEPS